MLEVVGLRLRPLVRLGVPGPSLLRREEGGRMGVGRWTSLGGVDRDDDAVLLFEVEGSAGGLVSLICWGDGRGELK